MRPGRYGDRVRSSDSTDGTPDEAHQRASVLPTIPGLPWWGAVLVALSLTVIGVFLDKGGAFAPSTQTTPAPGWGLRVGFLLGVVLAALAVRRRAVFTAMVQPPLIFLVVLIVALRALFSKGLTQSAVPVIDSFPTVLIGTAVAVFLGLVRILAQPLRRRDPQRATSARHA